MYIDTNIHTYIHTYKYIYVARLIEANYCAHFATCTFWDEIRYKSEEREKKTVLRCYLKWQRPNAAATPTATSAETAQCQWL